MTEEDYLQFHTLVLEFEKQGIVTRTFRRLDPERQYAVITAILAEASEKGPTSINIKNIAERANVSVGSLYQYFGNRQGLLTFTTALVVRSMVNIFAQARPLFERHAAGARRWTCTSRAAWNGARRRPGALSFFARAAYHGDAELQEAVVRPVAAAMRQVVADVLDQAVERGEVRPRHRPGGHFQAYPRSHHRRRRRPAYPLFEQLLSTL